MSAKSVEANPPCIDVHQIPGESAPRERRKRLRAQVHWNVRFFRPSTSETVDTITRDLSSDGFYCLVNAAFVPGEIRSCTLCVPTHYPSARDLVRPMICKIRVIRVEVLGAGDIYGVGCRIVDYRFAVGTDNPAEQAPGEFLGPYGL